MADPEFHALQPEDFPLRIELIDVETGETVFDETLYGPGALRIPGFGPRKIRARVTTPNKTFEVSPDFE